MLRIPNRKGDNAPMAIVELVDNRLVTASYLKPSFEWKAWVYMKPLGLSQSW